MAKKEDHRVTERRETLQACSEMFDLIEALESQQWINADAKVKLINALYKIRFAASDIERITLAMKCGNPLTGAPPFKTEDQ